MSHLTPEPIKPLKPLPLGSWMSQYMWVYMVIIGLMLYACILFVIKAMFYKAHQLDQVDAMVMKTEHMIHKIHTIDTKMAINMEHLENGFLDY